VTALIGHHEQVAAFRDAFAGGRPHHAWLLTGPQGLGKALFAHEAATWLLAGCPVGEGLAVDVEAPAARFMAAGSHLDFKRIAREEGSTGNLRAEIVIGQIVRRPDSTGQPLREFLAGTPMLGPRRVVVIDAADDMNRNTANALLKNLEEPSETTIFLLISHMPGRLLPTIRSRCRTLRFQPLPDADVARVLDAAGVPADEHDALVQAANGLPGRALALAETGLAALEKELAALAATPPAAAPARAQALARSVSGKVNAARYAALLERAPALLAAAARTRQGPARARAIADWEAAARLAGDAMPLQLEPGQVAFSLGMALARLSQP
jgi:DNA polymerase-3 subunit delta'